MTIKDGALGYLLADLPRILAAELPRLAYATLAAPEVLLGITAGEHRPPGGTLARLGFDLETDDYGLSNLGSPHPAQSWR